jgi:3-oxoacyl-[acyl-carrier protein] reductase
VDLGLKDKVTVVTAASGGLGYAIAKEFAVEGAKVVIAARDASKLEAAQTALCQTTGAIVEAIRADCTRADDIDALVHETERRFGGIDVLISNSGGPPNKPFTELTDADWHAVFDVKLLPQIRSCRAVMPGMARRKRGRIVIINGTHGKSPHTYALTAGITNAALLNLTKVLSEVGAPDNILVNAINPGPIETDRMRYVVHQKAVELGISDAEAKRLVCADIPLGRFGEPEDIAAAAAFLASSRAGHITGALVDIDGGITRAI